MKADQNEQERATPHERSLKDIVSEAGEVSSELAESHRSAAEASQLSADLAETTGRVLDNIDEDDLGPSIEEMHEAWSTHLAGLYQAKSSMDRYPWLAVDITTSGTALVTSDSSSYVRIANPTPLPGLAEALDDQVEIISRAANEERAIELMRDFGLDHPQNEGEMSALDQFKTAHEALTRPISADDRVGSTSLIPMREAINATLDILLHRASAARLLASDGHNRPYRKAMAVLRGLGDKQLGDQRWQKLSQDWMNLLGELSDGKTETKTREEIRRLVNKATLYVIALLSNLDPGKLS